MDPRLCRDLGQTPEQNCGWKKKLPITSEDGRYLDATQIDYGTTKANNSIGDKEEVTNLNLFMLVQTDGRTGINDSAGHSKEEMGHYLEWKAVWRWEIP